VIAGQKKDSKEGGKDNKIKIITSGCIRAQFAHHFLYRGQK
jgi:hypothetical protein